MALVPATRGPPSSLQGTALVPHGASGALADPLARERLVERLRQDREAHSRKQIWTKDAHGGPYRKARIAATARSRSGGPEPAAACGHRHGRLMRPLTPRPCSSNSGPQVNANKGYDPLIQLPDGSDRQARSRGGWARRQSMECIQARLSAVWS